MSLGGSPLGAVPSRCHSPHTSIAEQCEGLWRRGLASHFPQQQRGFLVCHLQCQSLLCQVVPRVLFSFLVPNILHQGTPGSAGSCLHSSGLQLPTPALGIFLEYNARPPKQLIIVYLYMNVPANTFTPMSLLRLL